MIGFISSPFLSVLSTPSEGNQLSILSKEELFELVDKFASSAISFAIRCLIAILLFIVGRMLIRKLNSGLEILFKKREVEKTVSGFLLNVIVTASYIVLILIIIHFVGIEPTSIVALLASTGVGIGMALSGTLQNFAGGIVILFTHPYRVGDIIDVLGQFGIVKEIRLFHTIIVTFENQVILIPNGTISSSIVNNYTGNDCRRITWSFSLPYGNSFDEARECILKILSEDKRVLKDPPCKVFIDNFVDDRVVFNVWAWAKGEVLVDVKQDVGERIYKEYIQKGLKQMYPRMDVVVKEREG